MKEPMQTTLQPKRFAASKSKFFVGLFWVHIVFCIAWAVLIWQRVQITSFDYIFIVLLVATCAYHFYRLKNTYYELQNDTLFYRSGFTKGSIPVSSIRKIEKESKTIGDFKAALSGKGLLIIYNKWDEVFVAPKEPENFLQELLKLNPDIEIKVPKAKAKAA